MTQELQNMIENIIVTNIDEILIVPSMRGRKFSMHDRPNFGLSFCFDGEIRYSHLGKTFISDPDHAVFLPKGATYCLYGEKSGRFPLINFQCENFSIDTFEVLPLHDAEHMFHIFEQLHTQSLFPHTKHLQMSYLYRILHELTAIPAQHGDLLSPAVAYLHANFSDPSLNNTILAAQSSISEVYFRKLFTARYGITPHKYLLTIRLQRACRLLSQGQLRISDVALDCGFSSVYHFCRAFKAAYAVTPGEYAQKHRSFIL